MNTSNLKSYFINTLLTVALCAGYCYLGGFLGLVLSLLIVSLLGVVMHRYHYLFGISNGLVMLIIFTLFSGPVQALSTGVPIILLALTLAVGTRKRSGLYLILLWCTGLYILDVIAGMEILNSITGGTVNLNSMMLDMGQDMREVLLTQYTEPAYQTMIEKAVSSVVDISIMLAPSMFTVFSLVLAYILVWVYKKVQIAQKQDMSFLLPFDYMQADKPMAIFYLILVALLFAADRDGMFFAAAANVTVIITFIFFMLGLSVFSYNLKAKGAKDFTRKLLIGALICFSTVFFMLPLLSVTISGLLDAFFDYRQLRRCETQKSDESNRNF